MSLDPSPRVRQAYGGLHARADALHFGVPRFQNLLPWGRTLRQPARAQDILEAIVFRFTGTRVAAHAHDVKL